MKIKIETQVASRMKASELREGQIASVEKSGGTVYAIRSWAGI